MNNFALQLLLNEDYCSTCVKYKGITRHEFPDAIHFHHNKECLLFMVIHFGSPLSISHFFSLPQQQYLMNPSSVNMEYLKMFRGGGKSLLCWVLRNLVEQNIIHTTDKIELEAGGNEVDEVMIIRLIDYYKNLGFWAIDETQEKINGYPMESTVGDVLSNCESNHSSIELFLQSQRFSMDN